MENKIVVKNLSTREQVLHRKMEKKRLEEEQYKRELEDICYGYQEDVKNLKKVY